MTTTPKALARGRGEFRDATVWNAANSISDTIDQYLAGIDAKVLVFAPRLATAYSGDRGRDVGALSASRTPAVRGRGDSPLARAGQRADGPRDGASGDTGDLAQQNLRGTVWVSRIRCVRASGVLSTHTRSAQ
jgi:hypothetical protein